MSGPRRSGPWWVSAITSAASCSQLAKVSGLRVADVTPRGVRVQRVELRPMAVPREETETTEDAAQPARCRSTSPSHVGGFLVQDGCAWARWRCALER